MVRDSRPCAGELIGDPPVGVSWEEEWIPLVSEFLRLLGDTDSTVRQNNTIAHNKVNHGDAITALVADGWPEDEAVAATLEDVSATAIEKIARGRSARGYVKRLRGVYKRAATVIEGGARGMFGRRRVRRIRTEATAIIKMQRQMRAKIARMEYAKALKASRQGRAVSTISRAYRGLLGRRRMAHKRALVRAAKVAAEGVSVRRASSRESGASHPRRTRHRWQLGCSCCCGC